MEVRQLINLNCKICLMQYDEEEHCPKIIPCGHSICKVCFVRILALNKYKCPYCKIEYSYINELPVNHEIISMVLEKTKENVCSTHYNELLNFYCQDCKQLICQLCLLNNHISHSFVKPEDSEISKSYKFINEYKEFKNDFLQFKYRAASKFKEQPMKIDDKFNEILKGVKEIPQIYKYSQTLLIRKINKIEMDLSELTSNLDKEKESLQKGSSQKFDIDFAKRLEVIKKEIEDVKSQNLHENIENNELFMKIQNFLSMFKQEDSHCGGNLTELLRPEFKDISNIVEFLMERNPFIIKYNTSTTSKKNKHLIVNISIKTECNIDFVINIMKSTDRIDFVPDKSIQLSNAYNVSPLIIGWNTTISAPYMHMVTLSYLYKHFDNHGIKKSNLKGIDIGCGSGFMTLCISKLLGPYSVTYGVDHIEGIVEYAKNNINKHHREYTSTGRVKICLGDGRKDKDYGGPFNIIHVGAAVEEIPHFLYQQLDLGGIMWIPVGPKNNFKKIFLIEKDDKGVITRNELMTVSYAEMVSIEEQLQEDLIEDEYDEQEANMI